MNKPIDWLIVIQVTSSTDVSNFDACSVDDVDTPPDDLSGWDADF